MTIAIHISRRDDIHKYVLKSFLTAAEAHPDDHFIFISDTPSITGMSLPGNCTPVHIGPEIKNGLLRYYWYNYKIPATLNRYHAEVLFTPREVCSLNTEVPQVMLLSEIIPSRGGRREQLRKKYAEKAFRIGTFETAVYARASKLFPKKKLFNTPHGLNSKTVIQNDEKDHPYFAALINKHNRHEIVMLLKAFSLFKKWQRSSYQLKLIVNLQGHPEPVPNFSNYKYRNDVELISNPGLKNTIATLANSFAIIQLFNAPEGSRTETEAMHYGIPVISTCPETERQNYFSSSALYAANSDAGIAEQLMRLYKDENTYRHFSNAAKEFAGQFSWQAGAETLYRIAGEAVAQRL